MEKRYLNRAFLSSKSTQKFEEIRKHCLKSRTLFEDPEFDCYYSKEPNVKWLRPREIVENPAFLVQGVSRFDVQQGGLGDCWLLAAVANLTLNPVLFEKVVPIDQEFDENYAGIFHFRFWLYGRWEDIVIDDRLPTKYGSLMFLKSADDNEFWSALLEKAYAKLYGSYEALEGGFTNEAMVDFTGGITETIRIKEKPPQANLFQLLYKAYERGALMGCSISAKANEMEYKTPNGLVKGHAYSITCVKILSRQHDIHRLIRIRNPWGEETEWNGPWSDKSQEWAYISDNEKKAMGLVFDSDGEFWMSITDFEKHFDKIEVCNLSPDLSSEERTTKFQWESSIFKGEWVRGLTAGGNYNEQTFFQNPQYVIQLTDPDEDDDDDKCTLIVALLQKFNRKRFDNERFCAQIGFAIFRLMDDNAETPLTEKQLNDRTFREACKFAYAREVTGRFKLPPGNYCIVPSTFVPNDEAEFILRVFTEKKAKMEENDGTEGKAGISCISEVKKQPAESNGIEKLFEVASGKDKEIDWKELLEILNLKFGKGVFSKDACRSMIALMDVDRSGKLGLQEFKELWTDIYKWKDIFSSIVPADESLNISLLRVALLKAGFRLNHQMLKILVFRYATKDGLISLDDFITCAIRLKKITDFIKAKKDQLPKSFDLNEWIETILYS